MNCREVQSHLFAEGERTPEGPARADFESHLATCAGCRRIRDDLTVTFTTWRNDVTAGPVPDPDREWYAVRRRIRGGAAAGTTSATQRTQKLLTWVGVPLGAAAAVAFALFLSPRATAPDAAPAVTAAPAQVARADSVDVVANNASTMVMVDEKSGWLFVWADSTPKQG